jgi:hypothetical protein
MIVERTGVHAHANFARLRLAGSGDIYELEVIEPGGREQFDGFH